MLYYLNNRNKLKFFIKSLRKNSKTHLSFSIILIFSPQMGTIGNKLIIICSILSHILANHVGFAYNISAFFVFGDSSVEVGNNYYLDTLAKPEYPNGIDFPKGTPSGRYTNSRNIADIVGKFLQNSFVIYIRYLFYLLCYRKRECNSCFMMLTWDISIWDEKKYEINRFRLDLIW